VTQNQQIDNHKPANLQDHKTIQIIEKQREKVCYITHGCGHKITANGTIKRKDTKTENDMVLQSHHHHFTPLQPEKEKTQGL
jgi:hypothetical protein